MSETLERGRASYARQAWADARDELAAADDELSLDSEDLHRLAVAAYLSGHTDAAVEAWSRAHREALARGALEQAARNAFWLCFVLMDEGQMAQAGGWLSRARKLLDDLDDSSAIAGFVLLPDAIGCLLGSRFEEAEQRFAEVAAIGDRSRDVDLQTLGLFGLGQALVRLGRTTEGLAKLDESMIAVTAGEVSPVIAGLIYCGVIEACHAVFDVRRAQEWTGALTRWCDAQPGLVRYRGQCLVHRAELMQLHGTWPEALLETRQAVRRLTDPPPQQAAGDAFYQLGDLHRLLGQFDEADVAFRKANEWGRLPQPGLALLRSAQGRADTALTALRRVLDQGEERLTRFKLLAAVVDVALQADDVASARAAVDELVETAAGMDMPFLTALCAHAEGAVLLREGDTRAAAAALRSAWTIWRELDAPYEAARARVLLGLACREAGDTDAADMEFEAAAAVFTSLGASPDLAGLADLTQPDSALPDGLTAREVEVLRLVATGASNRVIADDLGISEKTVARHLSNIFMKLGVSSRAAATAYAYEHDLVLRV